MRSTTIATYLVGRNGGLVRWIRQGVQVLKALGPYAAIELLLPGGSLLALLLWLSRRRRRLRAQAANHWPASAAVFRPERARMLEPATARAAS
jgi:hypothetical protein